MRIFAQIWYSLVLWPSMILSGQIFVTQWRNVAKLESASRCALATMSLLVLSHHNAASTPMAVLSWRDLCSGTSMSSRCWKSYQGYKF